MEMTGARLPKMKKSYHSNAVPADEAMMTRAMPQGLWWCGCATVAMLNSPDGGIAARRGQSSLRITPSTLAKRIPNFLTVTVLASVRPSGRICMR